MTTIYYQKDQLAKLVSEHQAGMIMAFATDTVFGLACVYGDYEALEKLKALKQRDAHKPIPMMCADLAMCQEYVQLDKQAIKLINHFSPGALTYIVKLKNSFDKRFSNELDTIALRIPDDEFILKLMKAFKKPLMVTSCNLSNEPALQYFKDVAAQFDGQIDQIVKGDALSQQASTIFDLANQKVLRSGKIKAEELMEVLNND